MAHGWTGVLRWTAGVLAASGGLWLGACGTTVERQTRIVAAAPEGAAEGEEIIVAALGGPMALDVDLEAGSLDVRVDPRRRDVLVRTAVTLTADLPEAERAAVIERTAVSVALDGATTAAPVESGEEPDHHPVGGGDGPGSVLRITGRTPEEDRGRVRVRVEVLTPRCDGVRVRATGQVVLVGVGGAMQVETERGAIEVRTAQRIAEPVALSTAEGTVYFQVPLGSTGRFDLQTAEGRATMIAREGVEQVYARNDVHQAVLNDGINPVVLRSGRGDVRAWVLADPVARVRMFR